MIPRRSIAELVCIWMVGISVFLIGARFIVKMIPHPHSKLRDVQVCQDEPPAPVVHTRGWVADAVEPLAGWRASQPSFRIVDANGDPVPQNNETLNVRLFELKRLANGGEIVNGPQLTGDCTSWAFEHAAETTLSCQVVNGTANGFSRIFPTFNYAVGRVEIWRKQIVGQMPSEGCSVAAICQGSQQRGFLSWDEAKAAGYEYSGTLADQWGRTGPPMSLYAVAIKHKVATFSQLRTADEVRDAVCNGYGVCFGSDFTWNEKYRTVDGRIVAIDQTQRTNENQRCCHAMACDGYDGSTPNGPFFHIQNSWYPNSHPKPIDGSPVCGFWVDRKAMNYIASKDDCFAISATDGFQSNLIFRSVARSVSEGVKPRTNERSSKTQVAP